jgi:hypothetical protein
MLPPFLSTGPIPVNIDNIIAQEECLCLCWLRILFQSHSNIVNAHEFWTQSELRSGCDLEQLMHLERAAHWITFIFCIPPIQFYPAWIN